MVESPPKLTQSKILLVEGADEMGFFGEFFKHLGIEDVQPREIYGKDKLAANLKNFMNQQGYEKVTAFAIIRDADTDSGSTFQSVAQTLENLGLPVPKRSGEFANKANKKVGVFIMPDGKNPGMLEHLCLNTVVEHPVMKHVEAMFSAIGKELIRGDPPETTVEAGKYYYPKNEAKAKAQAFLSGMYKTINSVGRAAKEKYWNFDDASLKEISVFVKNLRIPV